MRTTRNLRLGQLTIHAGGIAFQEAPSLTFDAARGDDLHVGVAYDYREANDARENARIRIVAEAPGAAPSTFETRIKDNPGVDDSRRGFLSVPVKLTGSGPIRVRFRVEADYAEGAWSEKTPDSAHAMRFEGELLVRLA